MSVLRMGRGLVGNSGVAWPVRPPCGETPDPASTHTVDRSVEVARVPTSTDVKFEDGAAGFKKGCPPPFCHFELDVCYPDCGHACNSPTKSEDVRGRPA